MDIRALEALRAVRTHRGVTAAAAVLHVTPSAVSQQLSTLQRDVGVQLTERVGRGLRLTAAGDALADAAVDVAVALEKARAACETFLEHPGGRVSVSAFQSGAELLLPELLTRVRALGTIDLELLDEDVAQDDFVPLTDRVDVVIAHRPDGESASAGWAQSEPGRGLVVVPLFREPLDVAVPLDHPLAGRDAVRPEDVVGEDWIAVREGFPVAGVLAGVSSGTDRAPRVSQRINDFHVVAALVAAGHGVALLPRHTFGRHPAIRLLPLRGIRAARRVDVLMRRDRAERIVVRRVVDELIAMTAALDRG
ncbi:LysR family transcriptional regulator [Cellulomonas aerilata]|uniref:LysR family transcriptional regulator n=1 Tax=Cellulomonas aerilata TaxID=515326 RepID=A0A512D9C5_9CELL|nr:LysR family transcriptional regulator [Cellulomonas aerilata]GEO33086.1 LysR family transcriptional regulator [Cellulomonas aerilata]